MGVEFYRDGQDWDANCSQVGLVGYANVDLEVVRKNVFDAIRFFLDDNDIDFVEKIISIDQ